MNTHPNDAGDGTSYNSPEGADRFYDNNGYMPLEPIESGAMEDW